MIKEEDFKTISEFSSSEYGQLYLVTNKKGEKYRKKTIKLKLGKEKYKQEFQRAIIILIRMNHPAINKIHFYTIPADNSMENYSISIFSDFEPNGSLYDLNRSISKGEKIEVWDSTHKMITIFGIAASLMYVHGCRLIYKNLKSTNVLFNSEFEPKLADFNLSRPISSMNMDGFTFESTLISIQLDEDEEKTPLHVAPEILSNQPYNNKVDVYSFGILLYEIFTNKEPDYGMDDQEAIKASIIIGTKPIMPDDLIPASYRNLINMCLDNSSTNRPSFKSIVRLLATPEYILPDIDYDKYISYTQKTLNNGFLLREDNSIAGIRTQTSRADELQSLADSGDVDAQYKYASILETGNGALRNMKEAEKYYRMACFSKKGPHLPSMHSLGRLCETQQKWEEAEKLFRKAAESGYKESQFHYAIMLKNGSGAAEKDIYKSAKYFKLAADQGDSDAQNIYANLLLNGEGVITNKKLALEYFKMAADQGDSDAQNSYGMMLKDGCDGEIAKNRHLAKEYLLKSAENGNHAGMLNYADFLREEIDTNDKTSLGAMKMKHCAFYYLKSSRLGNQQARDKFDQLGIQISFDEEEFFEALHGLEDYQIEDDDDNEKRKKAVLREAADKGDAESQYQYAMLLIKKKKKLQLAVNYLEMAENQNHLLATFQLGCMLRDSIGIEKDWKRARKLFLKAAEQGSADAMASYGFMRFKGQGFSNPNKEEGRKYIEKSVELQSGDGIAFLGKILEEEDEQRSEELIKESANLGNSNGEYFLAMLNRKKNNLNEVESLLRSSASKGNIYAQYEISLLDDDIDMLKQSADRGVENASFTYATKIKQFDYKQAISYFTKAAEDENNAEAMVEVAKSLWQSNPHKCSSFLKSAIKLKFPHAFTLYGRYLIERKEKKENDSLIMSHLSSFDGDEIDFDNFEVDYYDKETKMKIEEEAAHYYHLGAALNDREGMLYYGLAFKEGKGVTKNYSKAHKYLKKSADLGDVEAMVQLALFTEDENESISYLTLASNQNEDNRWSDEARYYLAMIYKDQKKYMEAFNLLEKAAKNGHEDAMFQVAVFYQNGIGVAKDDDQAMNYYAMSANSPNPKSAAQFNIALMLKNKSYEQMNESKYNNNKQKKKNPLTRINSTPLDIMLLYDSIDAFDNVYNSDDNLDDGNTVIKNNLTKAAKYFKAAAMQGDPEAMNNYGLMLMKGEGVKKDMKEAQKFFQMAADLGNSFGQNNLGVVLKNIDPIKAEKLFSLSAKQHNLSGMNNYGLMLMKNESDEKNQAEALSLFKAAADEGHPNAMYNYASIIIKKLKKGFVIYDIPDENENGQNVQISLDSVMDKYMKNSADFGDIDAMISYGSFLVKTKNDPKKAAAYFRKAADLGSSTAMNKLASLIKNCLDNKIVLDIFDNFDNAKNEMLDLYHRSMDLENTTAMNNLASLYYKGEYVEKDLEMAKRIFKRSMELGNSKASKNYYALCSPRKKK